jgi:type II secretory pathway pseudopilin PulG
MTDRDAAARRCEAGSLLVVVMIGAAVASIALAVATQAWSTTWRRDSERELIFRGEQYVNAILAYRKENGGRFPVRLEDLFKPGPRGLRYIRRLYKDPLAKDGKWGLLYLMPGGRGVYDPKAAQKAAKAKGSGWDQQWTTAGGPQVGNPIDPNGTGVPDPSGMVPGALPPGAMPLPQMGASGGVEESKVSEPPIGWPIVGVISRAHDKSEDTTFSGGSGGGAAGDHTFMIRKGHEKVDEWQFHVFEKEGELPIQGNTGAPPAGYPGVGPGIGGKPYIQGISGDGGPRPGGGRGRLFPGFGGGGPGGGGRQQGGGGGGQTQQQDN